MTENYHKVEKVVQNCKYHKLVHENEAIQWKPEEELFAQHTLPIREL